MAKEGETAGPIEQFMVGDHVAIDRSLRASERDNGSIDDEAYTRFRHDLLRHIGIEEKILLPYLRARRGSEWVASAFQQLRRDHSEIAKLLVRSPTSSLIQSIREILGKHNGLEEGPSGLYAACDAALAADPELPADAMLERLRSAPRVPLAPYYDGPWPSVSPPSLPPSSGSSKRR